MDVDEVLKHYIACAVWLLTDEEGNSLEAVYDASDLADDARAHMRRDVADFMENNQALLDRLPEWYGADRVGHDFWLTRNGHGAGFWDRGLERLGDDLTEACKPYGSSDLYVGDDGKLYVT